MSEPTDRPKDAVHEKYERLIKSPREKSTIKVAIVHPCDKVSLESAVEAARLHLIDPVLVGPAERIRAEASVQRNCDNGCFEQLNPAMAS